MQEKTRPAKNASARSPLPTTNSPITPKSQLIAGEFNAGKSIAELASQFKVTPRTIFEHLFKCAANGHALRAEGLEEYSRIDSTERAKVLEAFEKLGGNYLKPVFDALNGEVSYDELHVLRLYHLSLQNRRGEDESATE